MSEVTPFCHSSENVSERAYRISTFFFFPFILNSVSVSSFVKRTRIRETFVELLPALLRVEQRKHQRGETWEYIRYPVSVSPRTYLATFRVWLITEKFPHRSRRHRCRLPRAAVARGGYNSPRAKQINPRTDLSLFARLHLFKAAVVKQDVKKILLSRWKIFIFPDVFSVFTHAKHHARHENRWKKNAHNCRIVSTYLVVCVCVFVYMCLRVCVSVVVSVHVGSRQRDRADGKVVVILLSAY